MENIYMLIDVDRCWGCKACQVACKLEHGLSAQDGPPIEVARVENQTPANTRCDHVPLLCLHCERAECVASCPVGAIGRDGEGLVQVDEGRCVGCGRCVTACGFGAMQLRKNAEGKRRAVKCDLCRERRARGHRTSCEQHCLGQAFTSCAESQLPALLEGYHHWSVGRVVYLSRQLSGLGEGWPG